MRHVDQGQADASGCSVPVSSLVLKRQAQARSPRNQTKVSIPMQQDQDRQDGRTEVIAEPTAASRPELFAGDDHFSQDRMYYLSPFKSGFCGIPSCQHWEEDQGHYK